MLFREHAIRRDTGGDGGGKGGDNNAPPMITVKHGDQEIQVPRPADLLNKEEIEKQYVPQAAHNDQMARLRRELDGMKGARKPDELLADEQFKATALEKWGVSPTATQAEFQKQLTRQKDEITAREIEPLRKERDLFKGNVESLRFKDLRGQIIQAAAGAKIRDEIVKPMTKGGEAAIVSMLRDNFAFDPEHGEWFVKGMQPGSFAFSQRGGDVPYQNVEEFVVTWAGGDGKVFLRDEKQSGANANAGGGGEPPVPGQVGKELRLTADQIRDPQIFKRMHAKAEKEGLTIVPV